MICWTLNSLIWLITIPCGYCTHFAICFFFNYNLTILTIWCSWKYFTILRPHHIIWYVIWNLRSKMEGWVGVKDLKVFNICLLAKWRWRLVVGNMKRGNFSLCWYQDLCYIFMGFNFWFKLVLTQIGIFGRARFGLILVSDVSFNLFLFFIWFCEWTLIVDKKRWCWMKITRSRKIIKKRMNKLSFLDLIRENTKDTKIELKNFKFGTSVFC